MKKIKISNIIFVLQTEVENPETKKIITKVLRRNSMQVAESKPEPKKECCFLTPPVDLLLKEFSEKRPQNSQQRQPPNYRHSISH